MANGLLQVRDTVIDHLIPKEVIIDPFDGDKSVHSGRRWCVARYGVSGKRRNAPDGRIWPTKGQFFAPAGRRYAPLVVGQTKA